MGNKYIFPNWKYFVDFPNRIMYIKGVDFLIGNYKGGKEEEKWINT